MEAASVDIGGVAWETWDDPDFAARTKVRWRLVFSAERTCTGIMSMGEAEIAPGGMLPLHQHAAAEIYYVRRGQGRVDIDGVSHDLCPGMSVFIPPNAWHETLTTGAIPLNFLFVFPTDSFGEVVYRFGD